MSNKGVKTLTVPEGLYDNIKKIVDQASVKDDIEELLNHYTTSFSERKVVIKQFLSTITKYDNSRLLKLHGLIFTLLFLKYEFTKKEAFNVLEDIFSLEE